MAAVNHFYSEELTEQTKATTGYQAINTISGASLAASTKYLIVARGMLRGDNTDQRFLMRVSTADDSTIADKSLMDNEARATEVEYFFRYVFVHSFTTDGTPADVVLEFAPQASTFTAYADQTSLLLIDLDDLGSGNYLETVSSDDSGEYPTTQADEYTIAGSSLGTDEWFILGYQRTGVGSGSFNYRVEWLAAYDSSTSAVRCTDENEGEDTNELRMSGFYGRHKASSGTPDFQCQTWEEDAAANYLDRGGYAIALKTSAFADFQESSTLGTIASPQDTETTLQTITSYSPSVTADHVFFEQHNGTITTDRFEPKHHIEDDGAEMRVGDSTIIDGLKYDSTATPSHHLFHLDNVLSTDTSTYTSRAVYIDGEEEVENRHLIILSLELSAAAAVPRFIRSNLQSRKTLKTDADRLVSQDLLSNRKST